MADRRMTDASTGLQRGRHFYGPGPYVERDADEALRTALLAGEHALVLGPRGAGKSALRIRVGQQLAGEGVDVATVDLGAIGAETRPDAFCASLVIEAGRSLGLGEEAKRAWRRSKGPPALRLRTCLREVVLEPRDRPLVLCIDELELIRALGPARDDLFAAIRAMADARGEDPVWRRLSVVLIGAMTRDELVSDPRRSGFDLPAREIAPRDFGREQLDGFVELFAGSAVDGEALLDAVYEWTSGHPALTQWVCGDLLLRELVRGQEAASVEAVVRESFLQRGPELDPLLGDTARRLRRDHRDPYRTRILAAYERILRGDVVDLRGRQLGSEGALIVARLKVYGLVAPSAGGKLRVRNRVVERAFDRNWVRRALAGRPVSDALERWESGGRRAGALLRGQALRDAIAWVEGRPDVTPSERDFVIASEQARTKRLRASLFAGGALSLGLATMLGLSLWQYQTAMAAAAEQRASGSLLGADGGVGLAPTTSGARTGDPALVEPSIVATTRLAVAEVAGTPEVVAERDRLASELEIVADKLALERAARASLLAPVPSQRAAGLELALDALGHFAGDEGLLAWVPPPVTVALTANLPSPGDVRLIDAHAGPVERLRSASDGRTLASQSGRVLRVWDRDSGRTLANLTSVAGPPAEFALAEDGGKLAALSEDGTLTVWDLVDGGVLGPAPIPPPDNVGVGAGADEGGPRPLAGIVGLAVDEEGEVTLIRADGSRDRVDPAAGNHGERIVATALPSSVPLHHAAVVGEPEAARVVAVRGDQVELWDPSSGRAQASVAATVMLTGTRVRALAASPEAEHVVVQLDDSNALGVWDTARGAVRTIAEQEQPIVAIAVAATGDRVATVGLDGVARIWSLASGALLASLPAHAAPLTSVAFTADGGALLVGDRDGQLRVTPLALGGDQRLPLRAAALTAGGAAALIRHDEQTLEFEWSGSSGAVRWPLSQPLAEAQVSVDGARVALRWVDGRAAWIDVTTELGLDAPPLRSFEPDSDRVLDLAIGATGKLLVVAGEDRGIRLVDAGGELLATLRGHEAPVDHVALSPDGERLISVDRAKQVRVWDPATAALLGSFEVERAGEWLGVSAEAFVVVDAHGEAELWDLRVPARIASVALGTEPITAIALAPGGRGLAVARRVDGEHGAVELWGPSRFDEQGLEVQARFRAAGPIWALRVDAEAKAVVAIDGAGRIARWSMQPSEWVREACAALPPGSVVPTACGR